MTDMLQTDAAQTTKTSTKKETILALAAAGERDVAKLAEQADTSTSYVAQVLQANTEELPGYFDLYTSTARSMNVYAKHFRGKMRFKDVPSAQRSVRVLERAYQSFTEQSDRAGQHHTMALALTMMNRAWTSGKTDEAACFARWFERKLRPLTSREVAPTEGANTDRELLEEAPPTHQAS